MSNDPKQNEKKPQGKPENKAPAAPAKQAGPVALDKCKAEECKKKPDRFGFCNDHYEMYMSGVIKGDGSKPADYTEKLAWFQGKNKKAVA